MPKGHRQEREVVCRACSRPFTTTKVGKATWYCHRDDCPGPQRKTPAPLSDEERSRRRLARQTNAVQREAARQEAARERQRQRDERRDLQRREREAAAVRREMPRLEQRAELQAELAQKAVDQLAAARERLRVAEGRDPEPAAVAATASASPAAGLVRIDGDDLGDVRREAFRLNREGAGGRAGVRRAITRLAHAQGIAAMHEALDGLLAATLAWRSQLPPAHRHAVEPAEPVVEAAA